MIDALRTPRRQADPGLVRSRRDSGVSFIEILVAVVLLGTVVIGTLAGLRATILASTLDRDHANAHAWLQSAADLLYGEDRVDCGTQAASNLTAVKAAYQAIAQTAFNPEGWPVSNIEVYEVEFWNGTTYGDTCYDDLGINLQLVKIRARDNDDRIIETVELVKG
jgi:hypothetical protein